MLSNRTVSAQGGSRTRGRVRVAAAGTAGTPVAPSNADRTASQQQHREAHAAFTASLEKVVGAHRGTSMQHRELLVVQLALQSSSAARLQRQTHLTTLNMASVEEDSGVGLLGGASSSSSAQEALPLSQLAFKALLRASLAAARLHHGCLTTPHLLLGLVAAGASSLTPAAADDDSSSTAAASLAAAAEAAVVHLIDGPQALSAAAGAGAAGGAAAAASLLGRSCGLDVVSWVPQLSGPARRVLLQAELMRKEQGASLLTTHHLLAVMLHSPAGSSAGSSSSVVQQLLQELGVDKQQVAAAAAAAAAAASNSTCADEDGVACEPLGFLHEEFYSSLCGELLPETAGASAAAGVYSSADACLN